MSPRERGPEDYEDDDLHRLAGILERRMSRGGSYHESDKSTKTVVIGVGVTLLAAFVLGGWTLSTNFAALEAKVTAWKESTDRRLAILEQRP
jgi:hypothetical protein